LYGRLRSLDENHTCFRKRTNIIYIQVRLASLKKLTVLDNHRFDYLFIFLDFGCAVPLKVGYAVQAASVLPTSY
jgi:hypothetical protein